MSRHIAAAAIRGSHKIVAEAEEALNKAIAAKGEEHKFEFPDTAFYLPHVFGMTGMKVETLGQMKDALDYAKGMLSAGTGGKRIPAIPGRDAGRGPGHALRGGDTARGQVRPGPGACRRWRPDL